MLEHWDLPKMQQVLFMKPHYLYILVIVFFVFVKRIFGQGMVQTCDGESRPRSHNERFECV